MEKEKKEKFNIVKFILGFFKCIAWAILVLLMIFAAFLVYYVVLNKKAEKQGMIYKPPMALYTIVSPSMQPNINVYDVVFSMKIEPSEIKVGDVITFYSSDENLSNMTITHRVMEVTETDDGLRFKTKGDNNVQADGSLAEADKVIGKVMFRIPKLGKIQSILQSKGGWFLIILVPALLVISYDILKLCKQIGARNKWKKEQKLKKQQQANVQNNPTNQVNTPNVAANPVEQPQTPNVNNQVPPTPVIPKQYDPNNNNESNSNH